MSFVVFGASSGIGLATVLELSRKKEDILAVSRSDTPSVLKGASNVNWLRYKSEDSVAIAEFVKSYVNTKKLVINGMVLNAGYLKTGPSFSFSDDDMHEVMKINFHHHIYLCRALVPKMFRSGGSIVAVSSSAAENCSEGRAIYNAAKSALEAYIITLGRELGKRKIRANIVRPGLTQTDLMESTTSDEGKYEFLRTSALGKVANPDDVAKSICFLLSDDATQITCQKLSVHGGARI